jgi:hypothetical protein
MAASRARKERYNGMTDKLDCVVVGAGVVGLAIERIRAAATPKSFTPASTTRKSR